MRTASFILPLVFLTGCWEMGKAGDAKIPGDPLGSYHVVGELQDSTCGEGALGSTPRWEFDVRLSRQDSYLYWLNGKEAISGTIGSDGLSFQFATRIKVQASEAARGRLGCTIWRGDSAAGKFAGQGTDVPSFTGNLTFAYQPEANSDCSEWVGVSGGFAGLPCQMTYAMEATRSVAPASK
jgi:hypothetical protein